MKRIRGPNRRRIRERTAPYRAHLVTLHMGLTGLMATLVGADMKTDHDYDLFVVLLVGTLAIFGLVLARIWVRTALPRDAKLKFLDLWRLRDVFDISLPTAWAVLYTLLAIGFAVAHVTAM